MEEKREANPEYKSSFKPTWDKQADRPFKPVVAAHVVKEVKKGETSVEMLLRLLRGHGHIFNSYEIKLLEGDASAKKIVETYTDVKASKKLHPEMHAVKKV